MKTIIENTSVTPSIKKKYKIIMIALIIFMILTPEFFTHATLEKISLLSSLTIDIITLGLYFGWRFQSIHRRLRPFVVTRLLQIITTLFILDTIIFTFQNALNDGTWVPHLVYWGLGCFIVSQFFAIFALAHEAKEKYPDRCEFC